MIHHVMQKFDPASTRFDQRNRRIRENRDHDTGKARSRSQIVPRMTIGSEEEELGGINNVPCPDMRLRRLADQVLLAIFFQNKASELRKPVDRSTWNITILEPSPSLLLGHAALRFA